MTSRSLLWRPMLSSALVTNMIILTLQELVSTIDFRYITDVITKEEAIKMLRDKQAGKQERVKYLMEHGYPAYTTQVGKIF